jgi:F-type H+-transporting ATPase subunit delta
LSGSGFLLRVNAVRENSLRENERHLILSRFLFVPGGLIRAIAQRMQVAVAKRYARALFEATSNVEQSLSEVQALQLFFGQNPDVMAALTNPAMSKVQRLLVADTLVKSSSQMSMPIGNLLRVLAERNRFDALGDIVQHLRDSVDAKSNRVRGQLASATKLSEAQVESIRGSLEKVTQKQVILDASVDASLLGGVVAQVGSQTFDGSLRNQLREMERALLAPGR